MREAWYRLLVAQTLQRASASRYFEHVAIPPIDPTNSLEVLQQMPILRKSDLGIDISPFLNRNRPASIIRSTSGTTGQQLILYGDNEEAQCLRLLVASPSSASQLSLRVVPAPRRITSAQPITYSTSLIIGYDSIDRVSQWFSSTDYIAEQLTRTFILDDIKSRIRFLHVTPPWLLEVMTMRLECRGIQPREVFNVDTIGLSGGYATTKTRDICREKWGAMPISVFSCAEINGSCYELKDSPGIYAPGLPMFAEILDEDGNAVNSGEHGLLTLTALSPFQEVTFVIRYQTGDVVRREGSNGSLVDSFAPLGRSEHCLKIGPRSYIGSTTIQEMLTGTSVIPDVPFPRWNLSLDGSTLKLRAEANPYPEERVQATSRAIAHALTASSGISAVDVDLVPKSTLDNYCALYPER